MKKIVIAMPVYNEAAIIEEIVVEYLSIPTTIFEISIVILDDKSTDATPKILNNLMHRFPDRIVVESNHINLGHGQTLSGALSIALGKKPDLVISCDGDGPISGADIGALLIEFHEKSYLEVTRLSRTDPVFRKIVSFAAKTLVFLKTGQKPKDANTPIRFYSPTILEKILPRVSASKVPNLMTSILVRLSKSEIAFASVSIQERKGNQLGTMWGKTRLPSFIPNSRFIKFSFNAFLEILRSKI